MALQKGTLLAVVQKMLGHERLGTTALYLNLSGLPVVEGYAQNWSRKCWIEPFRGDMQKPPKCPDRAPATPAGSSQS
jgi:hypothetical protein